jgi:integrase
MGVPVAIGWRMAVGRTLARPRDDEPSPEAAGSDDAGVSDERVSRWGQDRGEAGHELHGGHDAIVDWEVIDKVPKFPEINVPDAAWDFYTREETAQLLAKARTAVERALLLFPLHTGARAGEQIAFEWGDIDWRNHLIILRRSSALGRVGPTKTGRERKIPMTAELESALKAAKHLRGRLVFCREDGKPRHRHVPAARRSLSDAAAHVQGPVRMSAVRGRLNVAASAALFFARHAGLSSPWPRAKGRKRRPTPLV